MSSGWANDLAIVFPKEQQILSSNIFQSGDQALTKGAIRNTWTYEAVRHNGKTRSYFLREITEPAAVNSKDQATAVFQVGFSGQNIVDLLDVYKNDKHSDPFLFHQTDAPIVNSSTSEPRINELLTLLRKETLPDSGQKVVTMEGQSFLVSFVKSAGLGWYLVDYVPCRAFWLPLLRVPICSIFSTGLLLVTGVLACFLLYRNVQIPIRKLTRSVQRIKRGDLSARIEIRSNNEFDFFDCTVQ